MENQVPEKEQEEVPWTDFLESTPPGRYILVKDALKRIDPNDPLRHLLSKADIQLHCGSELCGWLRSFQYEGSSIRFGDINSTLIPSLTQHFLNYLCRNCSKTRKSFAIMIRYERTPKENAYILKLGEWPLFG